MAVTQNFLDDKFLTAKNIMDMTGMKRSTVYKVMHQIKHYRLGKLLFVKLSNFLEWLEKQANRPNDE